MYQIGCAPCCWGVENFENPHYPHWSKVLDQAAQAGYAGIELGPFGYLPQNPKVLAEQLSKRNLQLTAGTLYDDLLSENRFAALVEKTKITCNLLSELGTEQTRYYVIMDAVSKQRSPFAGHPGQAPRLSAPNRKLMMRHIKELAIIAREGFGVRTVVHPHAGGYIEFSDEIEALVQELPYELVGLCLDSGHLHYSQMPPDIWFQKYQSCLDYVHFKDIDPVIYSKVMQHHIDFFDACYQKVMCPIGQGMLDYQSILHALQNIHYKGWITIEQERDPLASNTSLKDITKSLQYLRNMGF